MSPTFFATPADFRTWLESNHESEKELLVGFYKKGAGKPSITWPESVEEALCFGWIDGIRRTIDEESYSIRFTPRRPNSVWSAINLRTIEKLRESGRLQPAGLRVYETRNPARTYGYEQREAARFTPELEAEFKTDPLAWDFFQAQPPGYRKVITWWIVSGKQDATRARRLKRLMDECAIGRRMDLMPAAKKPE